MRLLGLVLAVLLGCNEGVDAVGAPLSCPLPVGNYLLHTTLVAGDPVACDSGPTVLNDDVPAPGACQTVEQKQLTCFFSRRVVCRQGPCVVEAASWADGADGVWNGELELEATCSDGSRERCSYLTRYEIRR